MTQYMLSVWHDAPYEVDFASDDAQRQLSQVGAFNDALVEDGALVFACGLEPLSAARVSLVRDGAAITTDGPYAEAKEHIGGFWIIDVDGEEAAQTWAEWAARACERPVEIRPLQSG